MKPLFKLPPFLVIRNTGIYTLGNALPQVVNVLLLPIFTRFLSPADYGILNYTTALNAFFFIAGSFSIHSYLLRHYFECRSEEERRTMFGVVFLFLLAYNFLLLGAEFLVLPLAFGYLNTQVPFNPYVKYALLLNFVEVMATIPMAYFRMRQEAVRFVLVSFSRVLLSAGLSLYFVVGMKLGVLGRFYGLLGDAAVFLVVYLTIIFRISRLKWNWAVLRAALSFSWPILPGAIFLSVTTMSDRLFLERFVPLPQMGIYALGATICSGLGFFTNGIYRAVEPEIYRASRQSDFTVKIMKMKRCLVLVLLLVGLLTVSFSREIVTLLASSRFRESYKLLALLVIPVIVQGITMPANCYLLSVYKTRYLPWIALAGAAASVTSNLTLIPVLGIHGAALSAILASAVTMLMYKVYTEGGGNIRWGFGRDFLSVVSVALLGSWVSGVVTPHHVLTVLLKSLLVFVPVVFLCWRLLLNLSAPGGRRGARNEKTPATGAEKNCAGKAGETADAPA
jgi:O-antigen/teichoic acid export membrane protein